MKSPIDRRLAVPHQVYELLLAKIQSAELRPGESINERGLAEWLGVSRTPIREAIKRLSTNGLVETIPNVGTMVAQIDPSRVIECCTIRLSLEPLAVEAATPRFTEELGRQLDYLIVEQTRTIEQDDMLRNIGVDSQFHQTILKASGLEIMDEIIDRVMGEILRARHLSILIPGRLREPVDEHKAIVAAMRAGNAHIAAQTMRAHLVNSLESVQTALQQMDTTSALGE